MILRGLSLLRAHGALLFGLSGVALAEEPAEKEHGELTLSEGARIDRVVTLYYRGEYRDCALELERLLEGSAGVRLNESASVERARLWLATCLVGDGRPAEAQTVLESALRSRPGMAVPDPLTFPKALIDLFIQARDRQRFELREQEQEQVKKARAEAARVARAQEQEQRRVEALERLVQTELVVTKNSRFIAGLPFGVGQFQNDKDELGWLLLSSEAVLGGTALVSTIAYVNLQTKVVKAMNRQGGSDVVLLGENVNRELKAWYTLAQVSSWGFIAVAAGGIVEAQLSFVPERTTLRRRELPDSLLPPRESGEASSVSLSPLFAVVGADVVVGLAGQF